MPELPEIETVSRALRPDLIGHTVRNIVKRRPSLRWVIPDLDFLIGQPISNVERRSKYVIISFPQGQLLIHLGMSGFLRWTEPEDKVGPHDHWEMILDNGRILRLRDHRRFGAVLWQDNGTVHPLLAHLGPEPLTDAFTSTVLKQHIKGRTSPIKTVIMDASVVVGVGNIYANEALFHAKIDPRSPAHSLKEKHLSALVDAIKFVLQEGIRLGGATLRDYHSVDGSDGLFAQFTSVYGRAGEPCKVCSTPIESATLGQRNTFWCPKCQKRLRTPMSQKPQHHKKQILK